MPEYYLEIILFCFLLFKLLREYIKVKFLKKMNLNYEKYEYYSDMYDNDMTSFVSFLKYLRVYTKIEVHESTFL